MGESAGGNLAACASLMWRDRKPPGVNVTAQVLLSPACLGARTPSRADPERANGAFLPAWILPWFENSYAGDERTVEELSREPYANPLAAKSLAGLPPLIGVVGGSELLLDEAVEYFEAVKTAGGDADWRVFEEAFHAFVVFPFGQYGDAWRYVEQSLASMGLFAEETRGGA